MVASKWLRILLCTACYFTVNARTEWNNSEDNSIALSQELDEALNHGDNGARAAAARAREEHWEAIKRLTRKNQRLAEKVNKLPKLIKKACKSVSANGGGMQQKTAGFGQERIVIIKQSSVSASSSSSSESSSASKSSERSSSGQSTQQKVHDNTDDAYNDEGYSSYGQEMNQGNHDYGMRQQHGGHHHDQDYDQDMAGHNHVRDYGRHWNRRSEHARGHHHMKYKNLPRHYRDHKQMNGY